MIIKRKKLIVIMSMICCLCLVSAPFTAAAAPSSKANAKTVMSEDTPKTKDAPDPNDAPATKDAPDEKDAADSKDAKDEKDASDSGIKLPTEKEKNTEGSKEKDTAKDNDENKPYPLPQTQKGRLEEDGSQLLPKASYTLAGSAEVDGRQGVAYYNGEYYVSGSTTLSHYDSDWKLINSSDDLFGKFEEEVNHIGDIDVYDGKIYAGVEYFMDGVAKNIQIAVYDAETYELEKTWNYDSKSGMTEVSGIAVDPDSSSVWMCSWEDGESGRYLYRYDLETGKYQGKLHLQAPPQWIQGIAYHDGWLYITSDDGTADLGEPDHVYRCSADVSKTSANVLLERTLDDVTLQGEIEGISFDTEKNQMLINYNRGARIVLGMPRGFYEGYDKEIHEVFAYDIIPNA